MLGTNPEYINASSNVFCTCEVAGYVKFQPGQTSIFNTW